MSFEGFNPCVTWLFRPTHTAACHSGLWLQASYRAQPSACRCVPPVPGTRAGRRYPPLHHSDASVCSHAFAAHCVQTATSLLPPNP